MSKVVGLIGSASGKLGNVVYAVVNGIQTARVYQPNVSNPKSQGQILQRAKGNLVGRLSSFVPPIALLGLGGNPRVRRSRFLRQSLLAATAVMVDGVARAKIAPEDVQFSYGDVAPVFRLSVITAANPNVLSVTMTAAGTAQQSEIDAQSGRLIAIIFRLEDNELIECVTMPMNKPTAPSASVATLMPVQYSGAYAAEVFYVPMRTPNGDALSVYGKSVGIEDEDLGAVLQVNESAFAFDYGSSVYLGEAEYTPA